MTRMLSPHRSLRKSRYLFLSILLPMMLSSCRAPAFRGIAVTIEPPTSQMIEALIGRGDMPDIRRRGGEWYSSDYYIRTDNWRWRAYNPVTIITGEVKYKISGGGLGIPVSHTIAKFSSEEVAQSVWQARGRIRIRDEMAASVTKSADVLPKDKQPVVGTEDVRYQCQEYYDDPAFTWCIAQLRYGRYYTELVGGINAEELSGDQFFGLVRLVDRRMQELIASDK